MSATPNHSQTSDANRSDDSEPPSSSAAPGSTAPAPDMPNQDAQATSQRPAKPSKKSKPASGKPASALKPIQACKLRLRLRTDDCTPPLTGWLKEQLARICELAKVTRGEITLVIVADAEMAQMHEQFTGVKGTTDVLTFDHRDDKRQPIESDLILCLDTAGREAKARGHETRLEVLLYAVHGLNHLLGGDDHTYAGAKSMHQWEDKMLTAAGFGAVFHRPSDTQSRPRQNKPSGNKRTPNRRSASGQSGGKAGGGPTGKNNQSHAKSAGQSQKKVRRQNGSAKGHAT